MRSLRYLVVLATALFAAPAFADDDGDMVTLKAEQVGQIFCLARLGNDTGPIEGLLTTELGAAIADAQQKSDAWAAANPGEKPPLGDGVPWQSWTDYAPKCTVGLVTLSRTDAKVEISYAFPDQPDADFVDQLILRKVDIDSYGGTGWRIDDVAYATGGDLKAQLLTAFDSYIDAPTSN